MTSQIENLNSTQEIEAYSFVAATSGTMALFSQVAGMPLVSFPLKIIAALSASQASIHVGMKNLFLPKPPKAFNPIGLGLALVGTVGMPITVGWGIWTVVFQAEKVQRAALLIMSLGISKVIGIPMLS